MAPSVRAHRGLSPPCLAHAGRTPIRWAGLSLSALGGRRRSEGQGLMKSPNIGPEKTLNRLPEYTVATESVTDRRRDSRSLAPPRFSLDFPSTTWSTRVVSEERDFGVEHPQRRWCSRVDGGYSCVVSSQDQEEAEMQKVTLAVVALMTWTSSALASPRVEVILDVSGSMAGTVGGVRKIDAARSAVSETMGALPGDAQVGLRLYGHRIAKEERGRSCQDTEFVVPFAAVDRARVAGVLSTAEPRGQTPLAYAIRSAALDFTSDEPATVILVSDGLETCGDDPVAAAQALLDQGIRLTVHTVGFDVDSDARRQLEEISRITGGEYRDARTAAELTEGMSSLSQKALLREKVEPGRVRGGTSYGTAVSLEVGGPYYLDHHQRRAEYDYFKVPARSGQALEVTIIGASNGVEIEGSRIDVTGASSARGGLELHLANGQRLGEVTVIGGRDSKTGRIFVPDEFDREIYLLVGNPRWDQHMDTSFQVNLIDAYDAGSQRDAGSSDERAVPIQPGRYADNYLLAGDSEDRFRLRASPGDTIRFKARPQDAYIQVEATDADGIQLAREESQNQAAGVRGQFVVPSQGGGAIFLSIRNPRTYSSTVPGRYSFEIERQAAGAPSSDEVVRDEPLE